MGNRPSSERERELEQQLSAVQRTNQKMTSFLAITVLICILFSCWIIVPAYWGGTKSDQCENLGENHLSSSSSSSSSSSFSTPSIFEQDPSLNGKEMAVITSSLLNHCIELKSINWECVSSPDLLKNSVSYTTLLRMASTLMLPNISIGLAAASLGMIVAVASAFFSFAVFYNDLGKFGKMILSLGFFLYFLLVGRYLFTSSDESIHIVGGSMVFLSVVMSPLLTFPLIPGNTSQEISENMSPIYRLFMELTWAVMGYFAISVVPFAPISLLIVASGVFLVFDHIFALFYDPMRRKPLLYMSREICCGIMIIYGLNVIMLGNGLFPSSPSSDASSMGGSDHDGFKIMKNSDHPVAFDYLFWLHGSGGLIVWLSFIVMMLAPIMDLRTIDEKPTSFSFYFRTTILNIVSFSLIYYGVSYQSLAMVIFGHCSFACYHLSLVPDHSTLHFIVYLLWNFLALWIGYQCQFFMTEFFGLLEIFRFCAYLLIIGR